MKKIAIFFCAAAAGILLASTSIASTPAACVTKTDDGGLPATGGNVVSEKKEFYDESVTYPMRTFSDMAPTGNNAEFCLRYEVENVGSQDVQNFYWRDAGIRMNKFPPGLSQRQSRSRTRRSIAQPEVRPTELNAFRNEKITPKVWKIDASMASVESGDYASFAAIPKELLEPGLPDFLQQQGIASGPALAVNVTESDINIYPISEEITGTGFTIKLSSRATREGDKVRFETTVALSGDAASSSMIYLPALQAIGEAKAANGIDYYASFISTFGNRFKEPMKDFSSRTFAKELPISGLYDGSIFLVDHPIMLRANDITYCYRVQSYSPFAVDFGLESCPM